MMEKLRKQYFWVGMSSDIAHFIRSCKICQKVKLKSGHKGGLSRLRWGTRPFEVISLDLFGFGHLKKFRNYKGILTIVENFSSFTLFIPVTDKTAKVIWEAILKNWICIFGCPKTIHTDLGSEFMNRVKREWCHFLGVEETFAGADCHAQNGKAERLHKFLRAQLRTLELAKGGNWIELLPAITAQYNSHTHAELKETPYFLIFGQDFSHASDSLSEHLRSQPEQRELFWAAIDQIHEQKKADRGPL